MFPKNCLYGCSINRGSKVTIVCPTGFSALGIGWYGYYLAKFGGFNYVCKSVEVDTDELDSYYNMSEEPLYNKLPLSEYTRKDVEASKILTKKKNSRDAFLGDIKTYAAGEDSWVILLVEHQKSDVNTFDFHFASEQRDGECTTVKDSVAYNALYEAFSTMVETEFNMQCTPQSVRYPLQKKNVGYHLQREGLNANIFVLRPSTQLVNFENNKMVVALRMAQIISEQLDGGKGIERGDVEDFATPAFGFAEKDEE
jgi:hypothetical protein